MRKKSYVLSGLILACIALGLTSCRYDSIAATIRAIEVVSEIGASSSPPPSQPQPSLAWQQPQQPVQQPTPSVTMVRIKSTFDVVNMRSGPTKASSIFGKIPGGTALEKMDESSGWVQVNFNGSVGWVSASLLE